jgi:hypothetical protein
LDEVGGEEPGDHGAVGEGEGVFDEGAVEEAFFAELGVEFFHCFKASEFEELFGGGTAALHAGAMAGGEGGGFVHEEQLGVLSGLEKEAFSIFEGEFADDPAVGFLTPLDVSVAVVYAASVAKPGSALGDGVEELEGVAAVFEWHWVILSAFGGG